MSHNPDTFFLGTILGTIIFGFLALIFAGKRAPFLNASSMLNTLGLCLTWAALNYSTIGNGRLSDFLIILIVQNVWIGFAEKTASGERPRKPNH